MGVLGSASVEERLDVRFLGNVTHDKTHSFIAAVGGVRKRLSSSADPDDFRTVPTEADRESTPDSRAGSSDDHSFAFEANTQRPD